MIRKITTLGMAICLLAGCGRTTAPTNAPTTKPTIRYEEQPKVWNHCNAASMYLINFEPDAALKELDTASRIAPDNPQVGKMRAAALAQK